MRYTSLGQMATFDEISMLDDMGAPMPSYNSSPMSSPPPSSPQGGTDWGKQLGALVGAAGQAAGQVMGAMNQYPGNQVNPGGYPPVGYAPYAAGVNQWSHPGQVGVDAYGRPVNAAGQVLTPATPALPSPGLLPGQTGVNAYGQPINAAGQVLSTTSILPTSMSSLPIVPIALGLGMLGVLFFALK